MTRQPPSRIFGSKESICKSGLIYSLKFLQKLEVAFSKAFLKKIYPTQNKKARLRYLECQAFSEILSTSLPLQKVVRLQARKLFLY